MESKGLHGSLAIVAVGVVLGIIAFVEASPSTSHCNSTGSGEGGRARVEARPKLIL
jgi:hypothetical protein